MKKVYAVLIGLILMSSTAFADFSISVDIAPPALPVYVQPAPPDHSYIWMPGYWAYDSFFEDYYWVPGTWIVPPSRGLLWTPGYWNWRDGEYVYNDGYWGRHVGFYGGINYGYGYEGRGFSGGEWRNNVFVNRTVNVTNVTNVNVTVNNSFNGPGGTNARPTATEKSAMKERHIPPTGLQKRHMKAASKNMSLRASVNHGRPAIAATAKPGVFKGRGIVAARQAGAVYHRTKPAKSGAFKGAAADRHAVSSRHIRIPAHAAKKPVVKKHKPEVPPVVAEPKAVANPVN